MKYLKLFEDFKKRYSLDLIKRKFNTGWEGRDYVEDPVTGREKFVVPPDEVENVVQRYIKFAGPRSPYIQKIVNNTMDRLAAVPGAEKIKNKVFIPIAVKRKDTSDFSQVRQDIEAELNTHGLTILDYNLGLTTAPAEIEKHKGDIEKGDYTRVSKFKIGKILKKYKALALMKEFEKDPVRQGKSTKYYLAFTANPRDLVKQSTGRGWRSCMNLFGNTNNGKKFLQYDILNGSIAVYITKKKDPNINTATGRITLKLYFEYDKNIGPSTEYVYGISSTYYGNMKDDDLVIKFNSYLNDLVNNEINFSKSGDFKLIKTLYCDYSTKLTITSSYEDYMKFPILQRISKFCELMNISDFSINDDYSIDVYEDVFIKRSNLMKIPIKFRKVEGNFIIAPGNSLLTLEGAPDICENFICNDLPNLRNLKGAPDIVYGEFNCGDNKLTSLEGSVSRCNVFSCSNNPFLTSLEGGPIKVHTYYASNCNLKDLSGLNITNLYKFICSGNEKLTSLLGSMLEEVDIFTCDYNNLTSLEGVPNVTGEFSVSYNERLTSLEGAPENANIFNCQFCANLKSLEGAPKINNNIFNCYQCDIQTLDGAPVGGRVFNISDQKSVKFTYDEVKSKTGAAEIVV